MEEPGNAREVYLEFQRLAGDSENIFVKKQLQKLQDKVPIQSVDEFLDLFKSIRSETRLRLFTLASFWNRSKRHERLAILKRIMTLIGGESGPSPAVEKFRSEEMNRMFYMNF